MKRVRITIHPDAVELPDAYDLLSGGASYVSRAFIVNWNVAAPPAGFLLRVEGDHGRLDAALTDDPTVTDHEVLPLGERECHCFLEGDATAAARALFENFTRGSLLTVPPVALHDDGSSTFTLVGTEPDIQAAVEGVPDPVRVSVEAVGGRKVEPESVLGQLSPRQREAVEAALELGYYDVPRAATTEDVARELDCGPATAAEHLQKAEATLVEGLFRE